MNSYNHAYVDVRRTKNLYTLNGHRKLLANLNFGPTVNISWIKSSMQIIPERPVIIYISHNYHNKYYINKYW